MSIQWGRLLGPKNPQPMVRYLDTNGDDTGDIHAIGDYSVTPGQFYYEPAPDVAECHVMRLVVAIRASGALRADRYGDLAELINGVRVVVATGPNVEDEILDGFGGVPVTTMSGWAGFVDNIIVSDFGSGDNFMSAVWNVSPGAQPAVIPPGVRVIVKLNDNFTGLVEHTFNIQGTIFLK